MPARDALPVLYPGTPVLARGDRTVHVGSDPRTALVLEVGPQVSVAGLITVLRRLRTPVYYGHVRREVRSSGLTATAFWDVLDRLVCAGKAAEPAAADAPALRVGVAGHGELARMLISGLPRDGHLSSPCDPRGPFGRPQLVVIADQPVPDPALWHPLMEAGIPHLAVHVRDDIGVVGPLVLPGLSSCLHCLDRYRADSDPQWPVLAATLQGVAGGSSTATRLSTAALAHAHVSEIAGRLRRRSPQPPSAVGQISEFRRSPCTLQSIPAPRHPRCCCRTRYRGGPGQPGSTILELAAKGHH